jgi:hypothetical protein
MATIVICNCCGAHVDKNDAGHRSHPGYWYCPSCTLDGDCHRCHFRREGAAPAPREAEDGD